MLRYIAALAVGLLLSASLADSFNPNRDANLTLIDSSCLWVVIDAKDASLSSMRSDIQTAIGNKAFLYSIPLRTDCVFSNNALPGVTVYYQVVGDALSAQLIVSLSSGLAGYQVPTVWEEGILRTHVGGVTPQDLTEVTTTLFDDFALAWKRAHTR